MQTGSACGADLATLANLSSAARRRLTRSLRVHRQWHHLSCVQHIEAHAHVRCRIEFEFKAAQLDLSPLTSILLSVLPRLVIDDLHKGVILASWARQDPVASAGLWLTHLLNWTLKVGHLVPDVLPCDGADSVLPPLPSGNQRTALRCRTPRGECATRSWRCTARSPLFAAKPVF